MAERNDEQTGSGKMRDYFQAILAQLASVDRIELEQFSMEMGSLELFGPRG